MIYKNNIYIRLMEIEDVDYKVSWFNNEDVRKTLNLDFPISKVGTIQWLQSVTANNTRKDFIICLRENNRPIGYCGLVNIDYKNRKAESYMVIGDKNQWGKGYATSVRKAILDYGFDNLSLNKIYSFVWAENEAMIHINKKVGYKKEGLLRADVYHEGKYRDKYIMGLLKEEYIRQ